MNKLQRVFWVLVCVAFMSGVTGPAFAAAFLKIGDIKGEVTASGHKDWIEIDSFSWGGAAGATAAGPVRGGSGSVSFVKAFDKASPKLNQACATGELFKKVSLHVAKDTSGRKTDYYKYNLEWVIVKSCSVSGDGSSESYSLNYEKVTWNYDKPDKDSSKKGDVPR